MSTNPKWPEITENLFPGQTAYDRPDLVARVFNIKKNELIHDLVEKGVLGRVKAFIYTVEFQKRGYVSVLVVVYRMYLYILWSDII